MRTPSAVAEISLSNEERLRIAKELGLDESQLDAIPMKLDIARFDLEDGEAEKDDDEDEVSGFVFDPAALSFSRKTFSVSDVNVPSLRVARLNKFILVAV